VSSWAIENYMWLHASGTICHSVSDGLSPREVAPGEVADLSRYIGNRTPLKGTVEKINLVLEYLSCQHELPPGFSIGDLLRTCGVPVSPMRSFVSQCIIVVQVTCRMAVYYACMIDSDFALRSAVKGVIEASRALAGAALVLSGQHRCVIYKPHPLSTSNL
jgi:hypothetical protein